MLSVLFVCVGNVCRSPLAQGLLAHRLAELDAADRVAVSSAGVRATSGAAMHPTSLSDLQRLGGDLEGFAARRLTESMVREADLVLAATRNVRSAVLHEVPAAMRRAFTIVEFAELAGPTLSRPTRPGGTFGDLVRQCAERRTEVTRHDLDVEDPIRGTAADFARVATRIDESVTVIADVLARHAH